ncbi:MAG TPA: hypothetical protein VHQ64_15595 [Pyrinomonadaceae bacterium]|jgi:hypothetical protein|nr:hypothetical protein [Pyrinomonadaceae bacterium]
MSAQNGFDLLRRGLWDRSLTPTATVEIDGFAICHFVRGRQWEIEFYHAANHSFNLENGDVGSGGVLPLNTTAEKLTVFASGADPYSQFPDGYYTDNTPFTRDDPHAHLNDFRWAINVAASSDMPPGGATFKRIPNFSTTKVVLENAVMFNGRVTEQRLYRVPEGVDPNGSDYETLYKFGYANDTLIAVIFGDNPKVKFEIIRDTGNSEVRELPAAHAPHQIGLKNMRPHFHHEEAQREPEHMGKDAKLATLVQGDFQMYYGAVLAQRHWSLWGVPSKLLGDRIDCDSIVLGP